MIGAEGQIIRDHLSHGLIPQNLDFKKTLKLLTTAQALMKIVINLAHEVAVGRIIEIHIRRNTLQTR